MSGLTTFSSDLLRSTVVDADAMFFARSQDNMNFGKGSGDAGLPADGPRGGLHTGPPDDLSVGLGGEGGGDRRAGAGPSRSIGIPVACTDLVKEDCEEAVVDGMPEVELFDLTTSFVGAPAAPGAGIARAASRIRPAMWTRPAGR